jgi:hypothetical protein
MKALTSIDWRSYGLTLASIVNQGGRALLEWEGLPPYAHIDIVLHCYHEQYPTLCYMLQFLIWLTLTLSCLMIVVPIICMYVANHLFFGGAGKERGVGLP